MLNITSRFILTAFALFTLIDASHAAEPFSAPLKPAQSFDVGTLRVDQFGSGEQALIFIPGLGGGPWVWHETIAKFTSTHTVCVLTLPGFDGRAASTEKSLFTAFKRDFWSMLESKKIGKPVVVGHSLGGTLAIALAQEHPERLAGVVAVDGLPVFPTLANATPEQRQAMAKQMSGKFASLAPADMFTAQRGFMSTIGTNKPELVEPAAKMQARSDPKAVAAWMSENLATDLRPDLAKITVPLLEIMPYDPADKSPFTQEQTLAFYKSLLAGAAKANVVAIAPSRHFVMLDQPDALADAIAKFLTDVTSPQTHRP